MYSTTMVKEPLGATSSLSILMVIIETHCHLMTILFIS